MNNKKSLMPHQAFLEGVLVHADLVIIAYAWPDLLFIFENESS
jgi:hypothetical protein